MKPLIMLFFLIFSYQAQSQSGNMDTPTKKMSYHIKVGESFKIQLSSNPTTGYEWKWANKESISIVEGKNKYKSDPNPNKMSGVGGTEIWTFKGIKKGKNTIRLEYCRPWDASSTVEAINITVRVK